MWILYLWKIHRNTRESLGILRILYDGWSSWEFVISVRVRWGVWILNHIQYYYNKGKSKTDFASSYYLLLYVINLSALFNRSSTFNYFFCKKINKPENSNKTQNLSKRIRRIFSKWVEEKDIGLNKVFHRFAKKSLSVSSKNRFKLSWRKHE